MPVVTLELLKMSKDKKAVLIEKVTKVVSEITELPAESFYVFVRENEKENVGIGGKLLSDL